MKTLERGFLLSKLSYSESSLILKCFTEQHGLRTYLFQGAKKKNANVLLPLAPIEFSAYQRTDSQLAKMTDAHLFYTFREIPFHPVKGALSFFMAEVLLYILHENVVEKDLFDFIEFELQWFDQSPVYASYPLYWLTALCHYQGIMPLSAEGNYFDMENGTFSLVRPYNHLYKEGALVHSFREILTLSREELLAASIDKSRRRELLHLLVEYLSLHIPGFKKLKSLEVIESSWYD